MSENRIVPRRRILKTGIIKLAGAGVDCTVRNISDHGAGLLVESLEGIPTDFSLALVSDQVVRPCRVVWRKEKRIGLTFD